ncbi:MAG: hypothetical protein AB1726_16580 [Planctomycetota bacterium]
MTVRAGDRGHRFGGEWTTRKFDVLAGYLKAYTTALKKTPFTKLYIDAFAGTGYREARRKVLFLDPYGMQVEWVTIEAVAQTKAIDLWVLFPLGVGVNRLLTKSGEIPESWRPSPRSCAIRATSRSTCCASPSAIRAARTSRCGSPTTC